MARRIVIALAAVCLLVIPLPSGVVAAPRTSSPGLDIIFYEDIVTRWETPDLVRCGLEPHAAIDFDWGDGSVDGCPIEFWSGYASGRITAPVTGTVQFCSSTDDGFALQIGRARVIEDWVGHGPEICNGTGSFQMVKGRTYPIKLWWFDTEGGATLRLYWDIGDGWDAVPRRALSH